MVDWGGSYPPGCNNLPWDDASEYCLVCGSVNIDKCICPECPVCGSFGDENCYQQHGLVKSKEQKEGRERLENFWKEEKEQDNHYSRLEQEYYDDVENFFLQQEEGSFSNAEDSIH